MAFVKDIKVEDNATPAGATAQVMAKRLGKTLRERFQNFIHKRECDSNQEDYEEKMTSRAIAAFSVCNLASVDDVTAGKSVCDSSSDGGIDALCINHNEKKVVVVQSKFNQGGQSTWTKSNFLTFKDACEKLQRGEYYRFDTILQSMSVDIENSLGSAEYKFLFVMAHTGKRGAAEEILYDMQKWQDELNLDALVTGATPKYDLPFQVHLVSREDLTEWLQSGNRVNIDLSDVEIESYGRKDEPYQAIYGQLSGDQVVEWWKTHGAHLFDKNIRNLLGGTEVNESIKKTASENPEIFWYYNNGITLLVSEILSHRRNSQKGSERGTFDFKDVSVINGAQTVSTIGQLFQDISEESDGLALTQIKIPVRFIKVTEHDNTSEVAKAITKANNHQNRVLGRDFASQDSEQSRILQEVAIEGYQYQLLRTINPRSNSDDKIIDLDEALDGLACLTMKPSIIATLKDKRGRFFDDLNGSLYKSIFNPSVSGIRVINVVVHLRIIESLIQEQLRATDKGTNRKRHLIITHGNRVIAALLLRKVSRLETVKDRIIAPDRNSLSGKLCSIIDRIESYIGEHHANAYPARFFVNHQKVEDILNVLNQSL